MRGSCEARTSTSWLSGLELPASRSIPGACIPAWHATRGADPEDDAAVADWAGRPSRSPGPSLSLAVNPPLSSRSSILSLYLIPYTLSLSAMHCSQSSCTFVRVPLAANRHRQRRRPLKTTYNIENRDQKENYQNYRE